MSSFRTVQRCFLPFGGPLSGHPLQQAPYKCIASSPFSTAIPPLGVPAARYFSAPIASVTSPLWRKQPCEIGARAGKRGALGVNRCSTISFSTLGSQAHATRSSVSRSSHTNFLVATSNQQQYSTLFNPAPRRSVAVASYFRTCKLCIPPPLPVRSQPSLLAFSSQGLPFHRILQAIWLLPSKLLHTIPPSNGIGLRFHFPHVLCQSQTCDFSCGVPSVS